MYFAWLWHNRKSKVKFHFFSAHTFLLSFFRILHSTYCKIFFFSVISLQLLSRKQNSDIPSTLRFQNQGCWEGPVTLSLKTSGEMESYKRINEHRLQFCAGNEPGREIPEQILMHWNNHKPPGCAVALKQCTSPQSCAQLLAAACLGRP